MCDNCNREAEHIKCAKCPNLVCQNCYTQLDEDAVLCVSCCHAAFFVQRGTIAYNLLEDEQVSESETESEAIINARINEDPFTPDYLLFQNAQAHRLHDDIC